MGVSPTQALVTHASVVRSSPATQQPQSTAARFLQMNQIYARPRGVAEGTLRPDNDATSSNLAQVYKYLGMHAPLAPAKKLDGMPSESAHHSFRISGAVPSATLPTVDPASPRFNRARALTSQSLASIAPPSMVLQAMQADEVSDAKYRTTVSPVHSARSSELGM